MALPEDLRSELLRSYSRDEFANYHQALLNAVEKWRHAGIWRMPAKYVGTTVWPCREDLRSELLRSYSRDELANYHQALLNAVEKWRHAGIWRMPAKNERLNS